MSIVNAKGFTFVYPGAEENALTDISFALERGEVLGLIGPVGAGKTTLCMALAQCAPRIIGGEASGEITVADDRGEGPQEEDDQHVGMVFEDYAAQLTQLKVLDEVTAVLVGRGASEQEAESRAHEILEKVGLGSKGLEGKYIWEISGAQQQLLAIAATLAMDPQVLILDNVMGMLDANGQSQVTGIITELSGEKTLVIVENNPTLLLKIADRLLVLADGEVIADGPAEQLLRDDEVLLRADIEPPISLRVARALGLRESPLTPEAFEPLISRVERDDEAPPQVVSSFGEPVVRLEHVAYAYPDGTKALEDVTLEVHAGEVHAVIGSTGAGKTTLLKHIAGLLKPSDGQVLVGGEDTRGKPIADVALTVGTVPQNPNEQISERTVRDEVGFPLKQRQYEQTGLFSKRERYDNDYVGQQVARACDLLGLEQGLLDRDPVLLPLPQRKLVTIAAALVVDPKVLLLDEPTIGLGAASRRKIRELIARLRQTGKSVLLVENDVDLICEVADTVTVLDRGRVVLQGPAPAVFEVDHWERLAASHISPPQAAQLARRLGMHALTCDELVSKLSSQRRGA
jgi:energy-coupling factor transport system ATP-binding protein